MPRAAADFTVDGTTDVFVADYFTLPTPTAASAGNVTGTFTQYGLRDGAPMWGIEIRVASYDVLLWILGINDRTVWTTTTPSGYHAADRVCQVERVKAGTTIQRYASGIYGPIRAVYAAPLTASNSPVLTFAPLAM